MEGRPFAAGVRCYLPRRRLRVRLDGGHELVVVGLERGGGREIGGGDDIGRHPAAGP